MLEKVTKMLRDYKADPELAITEQTTFAELELDSLDIVELIMSIEEEFSVSIEMADDIASVGDLLRVIENAKAG